MTRSRLAATVLLLIAFGVFCEGFDFTLDVPVCGPQADPQARRVCGVLHCTDTLTDERESHDQGNQSRRLVRFTISQARVSAGTTRARWQQLASVTPQQPELDRVSDGKRVVGQLSDQKAELSLELVKTHECQESQFSCVAISVDNQGRTSVKKSLLGKGLDSQQDFNLYIGSTTGATAQLHEDFSNDGLGATEAVAQLMSFFQARFDRFGSRLDDLENRLEDKVGDLREALVRKMGNLENRLEDKLTDLHKTSGQTSSATADGGNLWAQQTQKFDELEQTVREKMGMCVDKVLEQTQRTEEAQENISGQLATVISSVGSIENNLTFNGDSVERLDTAVDKWTLATAAQDLKLTGLASSVSSLSNVAQNIVSQVSTLSRSYAGGALVPVEEFSDPLGTGNKEWRLVFRGTAYNNVKLYPAYLHGTGIPVEVEEGCKQFNRSLPCVNHYRVRDAFNNWAGVDEVLFAVYKGDKVVQNVLFSGRGSTPTSWFAASKVLSSSWTDLTTQPHNYFSVEGYVSTDPGHTRRFHINRDYDGGCNGFKGWFSVKDHAPSGCPVEATVSMPVFRYAAGNTFAAWTGPHVGLADAVGIFLKYE